MRGKSEGNPPYGRAFRGYNDRGATPAAPGGVGFSLREAIAYGNLTPGPDHVFIPDPMVIALSAPLPAIDSPDRLNVIGREGVIIDGSALGNGEDCLRVDSTPAVMAALEVRRCPGAAIVLDAAGVVRSTTLRESGTGVVVTANAGGAEIGPRNEITANLGDGIELSAASSVEANRIHQNTNGIAADTDGVTLVLNEIWLNSRCGIRLDETDGGGALILNNTIDASGTSALCIDDDDDAAHTVENNIFSGSARFGIDADTNEFAVRTNNAFFANGEGPCSGCGPGAAALIADPRFIDPAAGDYRWLADSPLMDAGVPVAFDVNGPAPGPFPGATPDIGAWQSTY